MPLRLDWDEIVNREGVSADALFLFVLTEAQRLYVLALVETLGWRATWNYPTPMEFQDISDSVDDLSARLMDGVMLNDLIQVLERIADGVGAGESTLNIDCCGEPIQQFQPYIPSVNGAAANSPPPNAVAAGFPATRAGFENYACQMSDLIVDSMIYKIEQLQNLVALGTVTVGVVGGILAALSGAGIVAILAVAAAEAQAVYSTLSGIGDELLVEPAKADLDTLRGEISCIISSAANSVDAAAAIRALLSNLGGVSGALLPYIGWEPVIAGVYAGIDDNGDDIVQNVDSGSTCGTVCPDSNLAIQVTSGTIVAASDGTTYVNETALHIGQRVRVRADGGLAGENEFGVQRWGVTGPPENDWFASAEIVSGTMVPQSDAAEFVLSGGESYSFTDGRNPVPFLEAVSRAYRSIGLAGVGSVFEVEITILGFPVSPD